MIDTAVRAEKLVKKFGDVTAVDGIQFSIESGECFGFLGPNGAGKTSTIRMVCCTSPKTSGELTVLGTDVDDGPSDIKALLGVVQQENNLDPDFTCLENLIIFSRYFNIPQEKAKTKAKELLEFVQLSGKGDTNIDELSGGMKRRLMIARALLNEPRILVLDEPTTGLDPQARHLIWTRLRVLKGHGVTIILTTHYMEEAQQLCDRVVIMNDGKIIAKGAPHKLVQEHGGGGEVLELGADDDDLTRIREYIEKTKLSAITRIESVGNRLFVYSTDCHAIERDIVGRFPLKDRLLRMANLEDVFLKLTGRGLRE